MFFHYVKTEKKVLLIDYRSVESQFKGSAFKLTPKLQHGIHL